jgi:uncharacterized protein YlxP (DUF503 family)
LDNIPAGGGCQEQACVIVLLQMVVSMLRMVLRLGEASTIKDKRRVVLAIKEKLQHRYKLSCAEVDLLDSVMFAEIGAALVSNSPQHGETVLRDAVTFVEDHYPVELYDVQTHYEIFG